ncbi:MAG TPA: dipeptidase [Gaiellaceae bacterium]|nr:dipeptidase [Gaiellaceae bacterium]
MSSLEPNMWVVDGHNDLVSRTWRGDEVRHVHLDAAAEAGFAGGFFALFIPSPKPPNPSSAHYALPLPEPIPTDEAARVAEELYDIFCDLPVELATSPADFGPGRVAAILHLEGAEPLAPDLSDLERWHERGLRSIGLVWSRANAFAEGVAFRFPSSPDTGPGLSAAGRELVRACNELGILVDLSHLNEAGFWDVAGLSDAPLVATHSNAHALCPSSRNLTDEQLDAIGASGGVVGVNFAVSFLREDGAAEAATPLSEIVRHARYIADRIGIDHVAFGSDFDGALMPDELGGIAGFPKLLDALGADGFDEDAVAKIAHGNWLRVLGETWT